MNFVYYYVILALTHASHSEMGLKDKMGISR